ncbi:sushi, von Willebrand factor type A, EGF and pentraxin domain-containing protein 1-like isoform X2 [Halichondria panicea]|uniref:sushi, von Willebrand factor type A, EGF and pentraxin domain-containing protein 1-like isoform X2 n=1 Tax=Halichondria panicea TaxID=6063 RepID=UPI00312B38F4
METQSVQLLLLLCAVSTCWGQVYLTLGSGPRITTDNTEILITDIGEDGGLPSLTCHTDLTTCCRSKADNNGMGTLGQWTYPDGSVVLQEGGSATAGQQFYILRGAPQVIRLARREATNPVPPTGSYCCTVPTTGGDMTLCANLVAPNSVTCSDNLPTISNGAITYTGGSTNNRPVGATASYTCFLPYTLVGVSVRTCGSDGEWSSTPAPVCQMITCFDLPSLTNGIINYGGAGSPGSRPVDTVATYTCNPGYTLNGDTTRTCGSDGLWSGSAPVCQPDCPDLLSLANGMIMYSAGSPGNIPFSSSAVHSCNTGYTLTGGTTRICVSGGSWSGSPPTCQVNTGPTEPPTTCSDLTVPANGMISYNMGTASLRPVNTVATYTCNPGFTLNGGSTRTCGSGGSWSGSAPNCVVDIGPTDPPPTTCPVLIAPSNGMIRYNMGTRPVDTVATYTCVTGYTLNGGTTRTCGSDGMWSGLPPVCQSTCPDLTLPTNGVIIYSSSTSPHPKGTVATQICLNGYVPSATSTATRVCGADRLWSGSALTCQLPPVYVSIGTTNYAVMNSQVAIDTIGDTTETALTCRTDSTICCTGRDNPNSANGLGYWLFPNGTVVTRSLDITDSDTDLLYSVGDTGALRLHRRGSVSGPTGSYCCVIPDNTVIIQAFCVQLASTDESSVGAQSDNTGAVVGGVVALVAMVVIAVTVVMVTYLVLRYKRGGKITAPRDISLTDQGQSAAATYETVPATYEEIPGSREVKGDYSYTQNNAYSTVSGREAPAAGGIYDN